MNNRENKLLRPALLAVALSLLSVSLHCSYAQNPTVRSYFINEDLKHYSTEIVPTGAPTAGVVMSGTRFGAAGAAGNPNWTHFVRTDNTGVVQVWNYFQEGNTGYEDERCIDIASNPTDHNQYFLTSLVRFNTGFGVYKDRIKIYEVDYNGNLVRSTIIESLGPQYTNIYPIHTLYDDATNALFICGYTLQDGTLLTSNKQGPTYHGGLFANRWEKEAFVMKVDAATLTVSNFESYNYAYNATVFGLGTYICPSFYDPTNWNPVNQPTSPMWGDYDMAMRLTKIQGGMIHVTGSVTALHMACDDPNVAPGPMWNCQNTLASGIMNVVIDPTVAPNTQMLVFNRPFKDEEMDYSFGVGITQAGSGDYYILGNHMTPEIRTGAGIVDENGFEPYMHGMFFANLENIGGNPTPRYNPDPQTLFNTGVIDPVSLLPAYNAPGPLYSLIPYGPRGGQVENWAVNPLRSDRASIYTGGGNSSAMTSWVAGYRANGTWLSWAGCSHAYPPSLSNVTPSLSQWDLAWNSANGIQATVHTTKDHMTQFGTGPDVYGANSFRQLGEGLSNIGWPPTFACSDDVSRFFNPDVIMAVPFYTGNLNLKFIRAFGVDGSVTNGTDYCPNSVEDCVPPLELPSHVVYPEGLEMSQNFTIRQLSCSTRAPQNNFGNDIPHEELCDAINNVFKPGKPTTIAGVVVNGEETIVYPNPAQQYVQVTLAKGIGAEQAIKVELTGVQGQVLSVLYEGNAAGLSADRQLQLPGLASGLYFVQVYADGQPVCNQKLNVMQ